MSDLSLTIPTFDLGLDSLSLGGTSAPTSSQGGTGAPTSPAGAGTASPTAPASGGFLDSLEAGISKALGQQSTQNALAGGATGAINAIEGLFGFGPNSAAAQQAAAAAAKQAALMQTIAIVAVVGVVLVVILTRKKGGA